MNHLYQKKDDLVETWNSVSGLYEEKQYWKAPENIANLQILLSHIGDPKGQHIIEVGCGSGFTSAELARRGARCSLIDISPIALETARKAFVASGLEDPQCFNEDALANTVESDSYDLVWNGGVIEHFYDEGKELLLKEMLRMCKPGGLVIVTVPNRWCLQFQAVQWWQKLSGTWKYGFEDDMSPRRLRRLCKKIGVRSSSASAFNPVLGWRWVPVARRFLNLLELETVEKHRQPSIIGFLSVLSIRKPLLDRI